MNKVLEKADELRDELLKHPSVIEYLKLKEVLKNNKELQGLRKNIASLTNENKLEERDNLLAIYNNNPLVINYNQAREEVMLILNVIKDILK